MKLGIVEGSDRTWLNEHLTDINADVLVKDIDFYILENEDDLEKVNEKFRFKELIERVRAIDREYGKERENVFLSDGGYVIVFPNFASADKYFNDQIRDTSEDTASVWLTPQGKVYEYTIIQNNDFVVTAFHYNV